MARISIVSLDTAPIVDAPEGSAGTIESRRYFGGERDPIHMELHRLAPGATLYLDGARNDVAAYVWEGSVEVGGNSLDARSSLVVERGRTLDLTAGAAGAAVLGYGMRDLPARQRGGGHVHLMPSGTVPRTDSMGGSTIGGALHFYAACPTCTLWLHENDFHEVDQEIMVHSHSEDEVIFVSAGQIRLGNRLYDRGTAVFVAANTDYGFHSGPNGMSTVDFRGAAPVLTPADGSPVIDETQLWTTTVGTPRYLAFEPA
jgi:hypothetical protein